MIEIDAIEISLGKHKSLTSNSFQIKDGLWALVGRNGSGKSTFLNSILQIKTIDSGTIKINDKPLINWSARELSKQISVVYTKPSIFGNFTVFDVVMLGRLPYANAFGMNTSKDFEAVEYAIETLKIEKLKLPQFNILSDGEKQMVMIARAIAQSTPIIILDEPTAFLDVVNRHTIIRMLKEISVKHQKTIIFSTHDVDLIPELCDGLLWIEKQKLYATEQKTDFSKTINHLFLNEI